MHFFSDRKTFVDIGPISIKWYAIFILTGAIIAYLIARRNLKQKKYSYEIADDLLVGCLFSGIIGARLYYVIFYDLSYYLSNPLSILNIQQGGLAIHGGLIGGILFGLWYARKKGLTFLYVADEIVYTLLIAQAIGRLGNFMNQEAFGPIVSEAFFNGYPQFIKTGMFIGNEYRMPMFLYELLANLVGFLLIHFFLHERKKYKAGDLVYAYAMWYGMVRFFIEIFRTDALFFFNTPIKVAQLFSIGLILFGLVGYLGLFRKLFPLKPAILFDLDGTVMDTRFEIESTFREMFAANPPAFEVTDEAIYQLVGPTLKETFARAYPNQPLDALADEFNERRKKFRDSIKPMPNIEQVLKTLKAKNYQLGIVSNKQTHQIEAVIKRFNLDQYFSVRIGWDILTNGKPDPEGVTTALKALKHPLDNAIYVGDTPVDMQTAINADLIGVGYQIGGGHYQIADHLELLELSKEEKQWRNYTI